ncbi:GTP 3',8-cyclase MoaA [Fusobacterium varium]|uniref:GTP 3',8-cyclase MoaA n=1 Tax=Fusobacterium TaxID=848 RepID=UPI0030D1E71B
MIDKIGREIEYLRLSITDRCNLRCQYCMSERNMNFLPREELLTFEEIKRTVKILGKIGIKKIRLTGGEPLVRKNFTDILKNISSVEEIEEISLTTNGLLLGEHFESLMKNRLKKINISLDTLNPVLYKEITRGGSLEKVLENIFKAIELGVERIKLNIVLIKEKNDNEIMDFVKFSETYPVDIRFIELMPIGEGKNFVSVSNDEVIKIIQKERELFPINEKIGSGPAKYFKSSFSKGNIGFITPLSYSFCDKCNRIRLTPDGFLKLCLHWNKGINLKRIMRSGTTDEELEKIIFNSIYNKPEHHSMDEDIKENIDKRKMNQIGG